MSENKKDENSLTESRENVEQNDENFGHITDKDYKLIIDELREILEKEKEKSLKIIKTY